MGAQAGRSGIGDEDALVVAPVDLEFGAGEDRGRLLDLLARGGSRCCAWVQALAESASGDAGESGDLGDSKAADSFGDGRSRCAMMPSSNADRVSRVALNPYGCISASAIFINGTLCPQISATPSSASSESLAPR